MKRVAPVAVVAALGLAAAPAVRAQDGTKPTPRAEDDDTDQDQAVEPHPEGVYGGVDPSEPTGPDKVRHKDAGAKNTLHWIGFQQQASSADVFLQAAQPFTVEQHVEGATLVVSISGLTKLGLNVRRPLDTRYFDGPIVRVTAKARRAHGKRKGHPAVAAGIDVTITFRDGKPVPGDLRTATEADGMFYAYLTFAGGPTTPEPPAPGTGTVIPIPPSEPESQPATQPSPAPASQPSTP
ncbi:MAG TPA: hypothetical protein VHE35_15080 [Kofleriaceae bacterium]|nr:hypothetical protein [Kofleriaceae bacterium]